MQKNRTPRPRESALVKLQRKQFKVARNKPRIETLHQTPKNYKRSELFDTTNDESTFMETGGDVSSFNYSGLQLSPKLPPPSASADKKLTGRQITYHRYINKLVKHLYPNHEKGMSTSGKATLNDFSNQMFELITELASEMVKMTERQTLSQWDLQSAARIVLPTGLAAHANAFAIKRMENMRQNK